MFLIEGSLFLVQAGGFLSVDPELAEDGQVSTDLENSTQKQLSGGLSLLVVAHLVQISSKPKYDQSHRQSFGVFATEIQPELRCAQESLNATRHHTHRINEHFIALASPGESS
jgi:hypothetical protein